MCTLGGIEASMIDDQEIISEFVVESAEHLADIENELLTIEANGKDLDVDLVNKIFRGVHSIKGAAGFIGLENISALAHCLENVLNLMRERQLTPDPVTIDEMLRSADALAQMINDVDNSPNLDISAHVENLTAISQRTLHGTALPSEVGSDAGPATPAVDSTESLFESSLSESGFPAAAEVSAQVIPEPLPEMQPTAEPQAMPAASETGEIPKAGRTGSEAKIRVSVETIDQLMNLAGELVLSRNQLVQTTGAADGPVDGVVARISQVTSKLQDAIIQTRMQPVGTVFNRFTRVVRDLSSSLGKQCELVIDGKDVELDKTIIEAMGDPLTHLVRNSVDHGIEAESVRVAAGKPAKGKIHLRALHQSGKVRMEIGDDGGGIDPNLLKQKGIERQVVSAEDAQTMSDREALRLMFQPGLSTAEEVSDVSGRGVGMDVVKTNIEKLGGTVEVDSTIGVGTTISITLPLTLAIIPSLIVQCNGDRFAIPQVSIVELVRVRGDEHKKRLGRVSNAEVLRLRGELLPLVPLSRTLVGNQPQTDTGETANVSLADEAVNIVVVDTGLLRYGLVVEQLFDSEEIVVKPVGQHLSRCPCLSGATILGDGRVALILDVGGIAIHEKLRVVSMDSVAGDAVRDGVPSNASDSQTLLVFRNEPTERFAVSMGIVARIERIRTDQIDTVGGKLLLQYRGASLPLLSLESHTSAKPRCETPHVFVVVFDVRGKEVGLIAPSLEDIREVRCTVDTATLREPGVAGSLVIDDTTTRIIDLFELAQKAEPAWFERETWLEEDETPKSILLAEDSGFFRNQVKKYLEEFGFRVVEAEDGQVAWDILNRGETIDGVVTDVQMPNMTGFELCRRIRNHPEFQDMPVIALTSLSGEEDMRMSKEVGVDDYQVKMDRERLLDSVKKLVGKMSHRQPHLARV